MTPREMPPRVLTKRDPQMIAGVLVTEFLCGTPKQGIYKLVWVRYPFEELIIEQRGNDYFHVNFGKPLGTDEDFARKHIREKFCAYWERINLYVPGIN